MQIRTYMRYAIPVIVIPYMFWVRMMPKFRLAKKKRNRRTLSNGPNKGFIFFFSTKAWLLIRIRICVIYSLCLENGVTVTLKRRILTLIFSCLCFNKSLMIMNSFWDRLGHGFAVPSSYTCALSKSLNFTYFGSKITLVLFDNTLHSEVCIVFYRFPEGDFFYSVISLLNMLG